MDAVGIEKTAEWCYKAAQTYLNEKYGDRCWVEKVEVFEHEANSAIYSESVRTTAWSIVNSSDKQITETPTTVNEQAASTHIPVEELEQITQTTVTTTNPTPNNQPVPLRNNVTNGYSGLFDNISWGSR